MNINDLFTEDGMRAFTAAVRDQHMQDASQYAQLADIVSRSLSQQHIDGDRYKGLSRKMRAWKVARHLKAMKRHSQKAAASSEALNSGYVNHVLELPARREQAEARRQERKEVRKGGRASASIGARTAASLDRSAAHFNSLTSINGIQDTPPASFLDAEPSYYPMAAGAEGQTAGIADFFRKQTGR
jgi:hypothetical protein